MQPWTHLSIACPQGYRASVSPDVDYAEYTEAQWDAGFDPYRDLPTRWVAFVDWRILFEKQFEAPRLYVPDDYHLADSRHRLAADAILRVPRP